MTTRSKFALTNLYEIARHDPSDRVLLDRWYRYCERVRCALNPNDANVLRLYLGCGDRLVQEGIGRRLPVQFRMLQTLIRTAQDAALPWRWRRLCLEHVDKPMAQIRFVLANSDPTAVSALESQLLHLRRELPED